MNDNLILIAGKSSTGKSASLKNLPDPEGVMYLNAESNKKLPFAPVQFQQYTIIDPYQVYEAFTQAEKDQKIHTIVIDSLTFLMEMFESIHVLPATNTMKAWGDYAQFFKVLMSQYVAASTKNVIFIAHTLDILNENEHVNDTMVKVKGSLMNNGIESYFSTVVATKTLSLSELDGFSSDLLNITDDDEMLEYKYCFQTRKTKETRRERIRSPLQMWSINETFIDNDVSLVINRLHDYYKS